MRGNRCRECLAEVLAHQAGVTDAEVNLMRGQARVSYRFPCTPAALIEAVAAAGYSASIKGSAPTAGPVRHARETNHEHQPRTPDPRRHDR